MHVRLPLAPQHKGRPAARIATARGGKQWIQFYTIAAARKWMQDAQVLLRSAWHHPPMNGPLRVVIVFVKARPASRPQPSNRDQREAGHWYVSRDSWKAGGRIPAPTIPDLDNYEKAALDAISKADIWHDDGQVVSKQTSKYYAAKGEEPCVEIRVEPL